MPRRPDPNRKRNGPIPRPIRLRYDPEDIWQYIVRALVYIQEWVLTGVKPPNEPTPPRMRVYYD